jgi:hypothetical protein
MMRGGSAQSVPTYVATAMVVGALWMATNAHFKVKTFEVSEGAWEEQIEDAQRLLDECDTRRDEEIRQVTCTANGVSSPTKTVFSGSQLYHFVYCPVKQKVLTARLHLLRTTRISFLFLFFSFGKEQHTDQIEFLLREKRFS